MYSVLATTIYNRLVAGHANKQSVKVFDLLKDLQPATMSERVQWSQDVHSACHELAYAELAELKVQRPEPIRGKERYSRIDINLTADAQER
jgi:hypothetical protein